MQLKARFEWVLLSIRLDQPNDHLEYPFFLKALDVCYLIYAHIDYANQITF